MYTNGTENLSHRALQNRLGVSFPRGKPPAGWSVVDNIPPALTLDDLKARKRSEIQHQAREAFEQPVTDPSGIRWAGGFDSASKIKAAVDFSEFVGETSIVLFDLEDEEHTLALTQAKQIAALIGGAYRQVLAAEKAALRSLKKIDLTASDAKEQIEAVTLDAYLPP